MTNTTEMEYELTFLLAEIPSEAKEISGITMEDSYLPNDLAVHPRLRIRRKGDEYFLTKKTPVSEGDASAHLEQTIKLDRAEYDALREASTRRVSKTRYAVSIAGHECEVDVFDGMLTGLALIDFEFESKDAMSRFEAPDICGADVTQENFIAGGLLAGRSIDDIKTELDRLGYDGIA